MAVKPGRRHPGPDQGRDRPVQLQVRRTTPGRYQATGLVVQEKFGLRPYAAFMGALRVRGAACAEAGAAPDGQEPGP